MINRLLLIIAVFFTIPIIASERDAAVLPDEKQEELVQYQSEEGKFSIGFPESWEVIEGVMGRDMVALAPAVDPDDLFLENVNIIYAKLDAPITEEDYYKFNMQSLQKLLIDYDLEESSDVQLGGRDARKIVFTHTMGVVNAKVLQYLMLIDGQAYVLTFTADPLDFDKYLQQFERIANSFVINSGVTL